MSNTTSPLILASKPKQTTLGAVACWIHSASESLNNLRDPSDFRFSIIPQHLVQSHFQKLEAFGCIRKMFSWLNHFSQLSTPLVYLKVRPYVAFHFRSLLAIFSFVLHLKYFTVLLMLSLAKLFPIP